MKISAVEVVRYAPRWDDPFAPSGRVFVVYRVRTDDGLEGIGRGWGDGADHVSELLAPLLIGEDPATTPSQPHEVWAHLYTNFRIDAGWVHLSGRPGLGVELDEGFLARYRLA